MNEVDEAVAGLTAASASLWAAVAPESSTGLRSGAGWTAALGGAVGRRRWPIVVTAFSVVGGMAFTMLFTLSGHGVSFWRIPGDIWGAYRSAQFIGWGDLGGIYGAYTRIVTFPGWLLLLAPLCLVTGTFGMSASFPFTIPHPTAWWLLGPYEILIGSSALFALDALAERLDVPRRRRAVLTVLQGALLWNVDVVWGHPEDALALAFTLYALVCALDRRFVACGWLMGAAVATQPLVLLALPIFLAMAWPENLVGLVVRSLGPAATLLSVPLLADYANTEAAVVRQPNFPVLDHVTPWTSLAPHLGGQGIQVAVAAGPGRIAALVLAGVVGWWARRWRDDPGLLVGAMALCLSLRCLTESVMVPFYLWPPLAVGLVAAAGLGRWRLWTAGGISVLVTYFSNVNGVDWVLWWVVAMSGLVTVVIIGWPWSRHRSRWSRRVPVIASEHSPFLTGRPVQ